mgnify:CR=1 FL=1
MILTDKAERVILDSLFQSGGLYPTGKLALYSTVNDSRESNPSSGVNIEISGNGYARVNYSSTTFSSASTDGNGKTTVENTGDIVFPTASGGDWPVATHLAVISGGNVIAFLQLDTSLQALDGQQIKLLAGDLKIEAK